MTKIKKNVARECEEKASAEICRDREACDASASFKEGRRGRAVRQGVDADPDIVQLDNIVEMRALAEGEGILGDGEFLLLVLVAVVCVVADRFSRRRQGLFLSASLHSANIEQ